MAGEREVSIRRILAAILVANLAVAGAKIIAGFSFGLLAVRADGFHSLTDGTNNLVGLLVVRLAARPPDEDHPYGHAKFEVFASLGIAVMMMLLIVETAGAAIQRLMTGGQAVVTLDAVLVMVITLVVNIGVTWYEHRRGVALESPLLIADAKHTLSDVLVTLGVLLGLGGVKLGFAAADAWAALVVLVLVAWAGVSVLRRAIDVLADRAPLERGAVEGLVRGVDGVQAVRAVRSRGAPGSIYVDLTIEVDSSLSVEAAHQIADRVEETVKARFNGASDVLVHIEPGSASLHPREAPSE
ncbi:MAG: cation diffusion facilitator family transporter [Myxococcota bacterium]